MKAGPAVVASSPTAFLRNSDPRCRAFSRVVCVKKMAVNFEYVMVTQAIRVTIFRSGLCKKKEVDRGVLLSQN